jgi:heavy metal sensor kinase
MSRLSVRARLTLAFALAMAVVLSAVGAFLYVRLGDSLQEQLDESLMLRAEALAALTRERDGALTDGEVASADDEGFTQVIAPDGSLLASSPPVASALLVSEQEAARARTGSSFFTTREPVSGLSSPARLLVTPVDTGARTLVLVVGASLEDRNEALAGLLVALFIAGPVALVLSSAAGYALAAAALRPVEAMRRRANEVSTERSGQRLPLPRARDEIHRLGETLNAMLERLEEGLARERRFVADASHELRTPLALLKTELELALRRPRSREELEQALRSASQDVDRLTRLAEDLLVLARVDEGGLPLQLSAISSTALLAAVAGQFATRAAEAGRPVEIVPGPDLSLVGDHLRLEQALGNLVDNALRHGTGTVRLLAVRDGDVVTLSVSDEGAGFPPTFLPRAFDRFSRADEARGTGAAGLGLAIVGAIARAHGGAATAANGTSNGTIVSLRLPAAETSD